MKTLFSLIYILLLNLLSFSQVTFKGTWKGALTRAGQQLEESTLFYLNVSNNHGDLNGMSREELYETTDFAVKQLKGRISTDKLTIEQFVTKKSQQGRRVKWCRIKADLTYNAETGYLEGDFVSTDCKRVIGKLKLYRSEFKFEEGKKTETSHLWFSQFLYDQKEELNAPEIRKIERDNFKFTPIYFDFDEAIIRPEHFNFLDRMIKVIKGHSDLRVKVTGHTDSDGSDNYNYSLSKKRAESIINYFVKNGLHSDRLEFDFKGEKQPVDTNSTSDGKQKNRRVDFQFI